MSLPIKTILFLTAIIGIMPELNARVIQNNAISLNAENITEITDNIGSATLSVDMTTENISWPITQTELAVLMGRLQNLKAKPHHNDTLFAALKEKNPNYNGITLTLHTRDGNKITPLHVFEGNVRSDGALYERDPGRELEYWLFGTAKVVKQQILATQVLPIFTFNHCRILGNVIVNTQPRQCLLPDNNLLFEVPEKPTLASLKINDFDACLKEGKAIIHTFPRRCMVAGGRVFTEPPRLLERPIFGLRSAVGQAPAGDAISTTGTAE